MKKKNECKGYITIYLSLVLTIMLSLILTLIEGIRLQTIRFQAECVTDIGLNSIFAEYSREVLNQYGLLFIDSAYGYEPSDTDRTKSHLLQYMNMNFTPPGRAAITNYKDLTAVHADNARFLQCAYASDEGGDVLAYQIMRYMEEKTGLSYVKRLLPNEAYVSENEQQSKEYDGQWQENKGIIDGILENLNASRKEDEDPIGIDNPADYVEGYKGHSILDYAVREGQQVSRAGVNTNAYISHRESQRGSGLFAEQRVPDGMIQRQVLREYLFEKCGYYQHEKEEGRLQYQIEYLLYGQESDYENLKKTAERILAVRYPVNVTCLLSDGGKMAEAEELAFIVTSSILHPELTEAVKMSIIFAWAYAESIQDIRILFDGNKVPKVKTGDSFNIELSELLNFASHLSEYHSVSEGMEYRDFLEIFLFMNDETRTRFRFMDIVEMDIRKTQGNQYFAMDHCIYQVEAEINISSLYGYGCQITRKYSYE